MKNTINIKADSTYYIVAGRYGITVNYASQAQKNKDTNEYFYQILLEYYWP